MKRLKYILLTASALLCGTFFTACSDDNDTPTFPEKTETVYDMSGFVRGADVSWLTEMESSGYKFYNAKGQEQECMSLLRDLSACAFGSIRKIRQKKITYTVGVTKKMSYSKRGEHII